MSIQSEINRINNNVQESLDVCRDAGVSVASDANSNDLPGATRALASSFLPLAGGTVSGTLTVTGGANISGRSAGGGDDEGLVIGRASNNYAGLCLGAPSGVRSVFYLMPDNSAKWRYVGSSGTASDIVHPGKSGTIALTDDLRSANKIELGTVGIMASDSNEISFKSNASWIYIGYDNRMGSAVPVDTYNFGTHTGVDGSTKGKIVCGEVVENGASLATKYALKSEIPTDYLPKSGGTIDGSLDFSNRSAWITPYLLAFKNADPNATPTYPYTGFYQWGDEWQVNARDANNAWVRNVMAINLNTSVANFGARPTVNGAGLALQSEIPTSHAASAITAGTFAGQVAANSSGQAYNASVLRNTKLVSSDTNPTVNGEICWTYK